MLYNYNEMHNIVCFVNRLCGVHCEFIDKNDEKGKYKDNKDSISAGKLDIVSKWLFNDWTVLAYDGSSINV